MEVGKKQEWGLEEMGEPMWVVAIARGPLGCDDRAASGRSPGGPIYLQPRILTRRPPWKLASGSELEVACRGFRESQAAPPGCSLAVGRQKEGRGGGRGEASPSPAPSGWSTSEPPNPELYWLVLGQREAGAQLEGTPQPHLSSPQGVQSQGLSSSEGYRKGVPVRRGAASSDSVTEARVSTVMQPCKRVCVCVCVCVCV